MSKPNDKSSFELVRVAWLLFAIIVTAAMIHVSLNCETQSTLGVFKHYNDINIKEVVLKANSNPYNDFIKMRLEPEGSQLKITIQRVKKHARYKSTIVVDPKTFTVIRSRELFVNRMSMVLTKTKRTSQGFVIEKNIGLKQEVCRLTCDSNRTVYHTELMPFLLYWLKDDQMFKKITVLEPITGRLLASEIKSKPVRSSGQFQLHFVCSSKEVLATYNVHDSRYLLDSIRYKKEWGRKGNVEYVMVETIPMVSDN